MVRGCLCLALVLVACSPPAKCLTPCGMAYISHNQGAKEDCSGMAVQEERSLAVYQEKLGWSREQSCRALDGWTVALHDAEVGDSWFSKQHTTPEQPNGTWIAGYADCFYRHMEVGSLNWERNAYSHEIVHAIQGCWPQHKGWQEQGIYAAIRLAQGLK